MMQFGSGFASVRVSSNSANLGIVDYTSPYYYSLPTDPAYTLSCTASFGPITDPHACPLRGMVVHIPIGATPETGSDSHMAVIDVFAGVEYDFWHAPPGPAGAGGGSYVIGWGSYGSVSGLGFTLGGGDGGFGATHSGFALTLGTLRGADLIAGSITHALEFNVDCAANGIYPLQAVSTAFPCPSGTIGAPPYGARVWLDLSDAQIDALQLGGQPAPAYLKAVYRALAHYGAFVGDTNGSGQNSFATEGGLTYTARGYADPWVALAGQSGVTADGDGDYRFPLNADGYPALFATHLHVLDTCVTQATC